MWITAQLPHAFAVATIKRANNGRYDNANAKGNAFVSSLQKTVPAETLAKFERCESAHRNGLENLPFFAAAVLATKIAGVDPTFVNVSAWSYIALRVLYNYCYITIKSHRKSLLRSAVWGVSTAVCITMFVRAALE